MKYFTTVYDIQDSSTLISEALELKANPFAHENMGKHKTIGIVFMNPSLRTRLSTQKAAQNLGMNTMVININQEGWALEYNEGAIMNGTSVEHIKDAAAVIGSYCDIIALRCFPGLKDQQEDYSEKILLQFMKYCNKPLISLESGTRHPLQSLADMITIEENRPAGKKPKVVLTWAPHIKPLPQAVSNSFCEWIQTREVDFVITNPEGYNLSVEFTKQTKVIHNQEEALKDADFVYVKNWSSYEEYGMMPEVKGDWLLSETKMKATNNAKVMHCLPVRRNVEVPDSILDSSRSLILQQAENRVFAAQAVLKKMLETNYKIESSVQLNQEVQR
ncbi:acetylornithine carbamoyltransferase [Sphingobacteriaceae bacterium]|nr:acetylornithine carbamoyltransferase [Sphingobacteriaceae bacterium]